MILLRTVPFKFCLIPVHMEIMYEKTKAKKGQIPMRPSLGKNDLNHVVVYSGFSENKGLGRELSLAGS